MSPLKVVIINKSDSIGGAAIVSFRLLEALRQEGIDAKMLVADKRSDSLDVKVAASHFLIKEKFLEERLKIFIENGFDRETLFKIDTGSDGLPLWRHPWVKEADAIMLNWVNQGMLSIKGVRKILSLEKPVIWTMHDMWCMTGICHHAGNCKHFEKECGNCPLLKSKKGKNDLSHKIWGKKKDLYKFPLNEKLAFVAVSRWLEGKSRESSLLRNQNVVNIPNAFNLTDESFERKETGIKGSNRKETGKIRILFGAARLDDPIKGLPVLIRMTEILAKDYPNLMGRLEIATFGSVKDASKLKGFAIPHIDLGVLKGNEELSHAYEAGDILVSTSSYETLPGTLVEAQAFGCIPVSFNRGGQADIIEHKVTGYLAEYSDKLEIAAQNIAAGVAWATDLIGKKGDLENMRDRMRKSVVEKFSYKTIADKYIRLIKKLQSD